MKNLKGYFISSILILAAGTAPVWCGGAAESASSVERGRYFIDLGQFIPPEEIDESSYLASVDMGYPQTTDPIGITFLPGRHQISVDGEEMVFLIGIQGRRMSYLDLPVLNQALVIDKSGSMFQRHKLEWVREACGYFIDTIRERDYLAVVAFDENSRIIFPAARIDSPSVKESVRSAIGSLTPGGGSGIRSGLELGFLSIEENMGKAEVNRIILMTDGIGSTEGVMDLVDEYHRRGIEVSAIGFGEDFDGNFMRDLVLRGGGTSRFVSGPEAMREMFGTGFTRLTFPAARNLELTFRFLTKAGDVETWALDYTFENPWAAYRDAWWRSAASVKPIPADIAVGPDGNYYIADRGSSLIQVFSPDGGFITEWGEQFWENSSLSKPTGIAVGPDGTVFVADNANGRLLSFSSLGRPISVFRRSLFWGPYDVAVDGEGRIYALDRSRARVTRFDTAGKVVAEWGDAKGRFGALSTPTSITTDRHGNVYIADSGNNRVTVYEPDGTGIASYPLPREASPVHGIAVDADGTIFVTGAGGRAVWRLGPYGEPDGYFKISGSSGPAVGESSAAAIDTDGSLIVCNGSTAVIERYSADGVRLFDRPIRYGFKTVNFDDYETILVRARIAGKREPGTYAAAELSGSYVDGKGENRTIGPILIDLDFSGNPVAVEGTSDPTVLRAESMLAYAEGLKTIGELARREMHTQALAETRSQWHELDNADTRLGGGLFTDELNLLRSYASIILPAVGGKKEEVDGYLTAAEARVEHPDLGLGDRLEALFREVGMQIGTSGDVILGVFGFQMGDETKNDFTVYLDATSETLLREIPGIRLVDRSRLDAVLGEQKLSLAGLTTEGGASKIGEMISADYLITGTVLPMTNAAAVFCRLIDTTTGSLDSVAQVLVPLTDDIRSLLAR